MAFALRQSAPEKSFCDARLGIPLALLIASPGSYRWLIVAARYRQARVSVASIGRDVLFRAYRFLTPILVCFLVVAAPESAIAEQPSVRPITIRIRVEASSLPKDVDVEAMVTRFFNQAGFTTVAASASDYDAALEMQVKGNPLSGQYSMFSTIGGSTHYSGAEVEGRLLLESSKASSTKQFSATVEPPNSINMHRYLTPEEAPFKEALDRCNLDMLLGMAVEDVLTIESAVAFWLGVERGSGLVKIHKMGAAAIPGLVRVLGGGETPLRDPARRVLIAMGSDAVGPLLAELKQASGDSRIGVINVLGALMDAQATSALAAFLRDVDPRIRLEAASALAKMKHDSALQPLIDALKASDRVYRAAAVESLGEFADKRVVGPLIAVLKEDSDPKIRHSAARALAKMKEVAVEPLIELLRGPDIELRMTAIESLGDIGGARAVSALIDTLKGERLSVRQKIANALGKLTNQNFGVDYHAWARWRDQESKSIVEQR